MTELLIIAALAVVVVGLCAYAAWSARRVEELERPRDWRETWCCLECWAPDGQRGPCRDCAGRRTARR